MGMRPAGGERPRGKDLIVAGILKDNSVYLQSGRSAMSQHKDLLIDYAAGRWTGPVVRRLGLPSPRPLRRETGPYRERELEGRNAAIGGADGAYALAAARAELEALGATLRPGPVWSVKERADIAVFDATGCRDADSLARLRGFFSPLLRQLAPCARLVLLAADPATCGDPVQRAAARAVEGFVRALAKEVGRSGATANLLYVSPDVLDRLGGPLRFFCGYRSAYVSGRPVRITGLAKATADAGRDCPRLQGKLAVVTGAARGLGEATVLRLAEEGARVVCVDVPAAADQLQAVASHAEGVALTLDVTAPDAPATLAECLAAEGGVDIMVHNAGITRDRMLRNMGEAEWDAVMAVNLKAILAMDAALDAAGLLLDGGREILLSSISGVAGNAGQSNYAASKAALIGYASARAEQLARRGVTVNCAAPGFIETGMTKKIPLMIREAGRRMNALSQGGQPRDVAEFVTFLALPESCGVSGQTIRVCGQAMLGA
jgi:3-oxoacyl-[acyl-carrier protein] reductase